MFFFVFGQKKAFKILKNHFALILSIFIGFWWLIAHFTRLNLYFLKNRKCLPFFWKKGAKIENFDFAKFWNPREMNFCHFCPFFQKKGQTFNFCQKVEFQASKMSCQPLKSDKNSQRYSKKANNLKKKIFPA